MADNIDAGKLAENMKVVVDNVILPASILNRMNEVLRHVRAMQEFTYMTTGLQLDMNQTWTTMNKMVELEGKRV